MDEFFRLIEDESHDGSFNMAVDSALLQSAQSGLATPTIRLYNWNNSTISIGYAQNIRNGFNNSFIDDNDIPLVRRPTGGRAILHNDEVTYSLAIPASSRYFGSLGQIYNFAQRAIRGALESLGIDIDPDNSEPAIGKSASCFASRTKHEISVGGCKVVASAQRRSSLGALQHGSIVLAHDRELYLSCFDWPDESTRKAAENMLGGVNDGKDEPILAKTLRAAIITSFEALYDINIVEGTLNKNEVNLAETILAGGFAHARDDK